MWPWILIGRVLHWSVLNVNSSQESSAIPKLALAYAVCGVGSWIRDDVCRWCFSCSAWSAWSAVTDRGRSGSEHQVDHGEGVAASRRVRVPVRSRQRSQTDHGSAQGQRHVSHVHRGVVHRGVVHVHRVIVHRPVGGFGPKHNFFSANFILFLAEMKHFFVVLHFFFP